MLNKNSIFTIYILMLLAFSATVAYAQDNEIVFSLTEAIATGITNNPSQQANRLIVESAQEDAKADRRNSFLPNLNVYMGISRDGFGPTSTSEGGEYQSAGWSSGLTLYDGGARRKRASAQDLEVEALEASFNSTNAFIRDTSGALASEIFNVYLDAAMTTKTTEISDQYISIFERIQPFIKDSTAKSKLNNALVSRRSRSESLLQKLNNIKKDLEHLLYSEIPADLESVEQTNEGMKLSLAPYSDVDYAISVAKEKNQNYLATLYQLKATEEYASAKKAQLTRPNLELVVADSWSRVASNGAMSDARSSRDAYVGLQFHYTLQPGIRQSLSSSQKKVIAAKQKTEKETNDFSYNIRSSYQKLLTADKTIQDYHGNIDKLLLQIDDFIKNAETSGKDISLQEYDFLVSLLDNLGNNYDTYYWSIHEALRLRYSLLSEIGILFDTCGTKGCFR